MHEIQSSSELRRDTRSSQGLGTQLLIRNEFVAALSLLVIRSISLVLHPPVRSSSFTPPPGPAVHGVHRHQLCAQSGFTRYILFTWAGRSNRSWNWMRVKWTLICNNTSFVYVTHAEMWETFFIYLFICFFKAAIEQKHLILWNAVTDWQMFLCPHRWYSSLNLEWGRCIHRLSGFKRTPVCHLRGKKDDGSVFPSRLLRFSFIPAWSVRPDA